MSSPAHAGIQTIDSRVKPIRRLPRILRRAIPVRILVRKGLSKADKILGDPMGFKVDRIKDSKAGQIFTLNSRGNRNKVSLAVDRILKIAAARCIRAVEILADRTAKGKECLRPKRKEF